MSETHAALEASAVAVTQKITVASGSASFLAFAAKIDVIGWFGLTIAALGLITQVYFAIARNRREKEVHALTVQKLKGECDVKN